MKPAFPCSLLATLVAVTAPALAVGAPELTPGVADVVRRELAVDRFSLGRLDLPAAERPEMLRLSVDHGGRGKVLLLERHSLRGPGFRALVQRAGGDFETWIPPERTYRGVVEGEPGSLVAASLVADGLHADVLRGASGWSIRPLRRFDPAAPRAAHVVFERAPQAIDCGVGGESTRDERPAPTGAGGGGGGGCTLTVADIGFDSDYEFFADDCDGDPDTCVAIIEAGLNITNLIYIRDVKITHQISTIVIRSDPDADVYARFPDASDFGAMLNTLRSEWNANMNDVDHDVAYLLTGKSRPQYGGLAFVGVVCTSSHYGMGIGGWGYEGIFRHELGHNWGASHSCGAERRFIMCGNSIDAISAYNIGVMTRHRDSRSCLDETPYDGGVPSPPFARLDRLITLQGRGPVAIDVVGGDSDVNCDRLRLESFDSRSAFGASLRTLDPVASGRPESLLYTPRSDLVGTDFFSYTVADGSGFETEGAAWIEIAPRSLIGYLKFDETSGADAVDASGNGHDGELRDNLSFDSDSIPGRYGRALKFSGIDGEYVSLGDNSEFDLRHGITVAAWFRVDAFANDGESIIAKGGDAWRLKRDGTRPALRFTCTGLSVEGSPGGDLAGAIAVDDGEWHHAAGVYDGSRIYLYIDGVLDRSRAASGAIATNSSSVRIGDDRWNGAIDDVRIYNHGLTAAEVAALHDGSRVERPEPPDGKSGVVPGAALAWLGGAGAAAHDVYIGTERTAVAAATVASPEYTGRRSGTSYVPDLETATTYFWRVDPVVGGAPRHGEVRSFSTGFAFTSFDEPALNASSYTPGAGAAELGFRTIATPTSGENPFAGVIETSSTPTTPIFSHRSVEATTTFDAVDLSGQHRVAVSLTLQARDTGYEEEDRLAVHATDGAERIELLSLAGGAALTQRAGTGYTTVAASLPADWQQASLVLETSSDSSQGSERFDFDGVGFFCHRPFTVIASTGFDEPAVGASSYTPGAGAGELGFETLSAPSGGANPFAGVVEGGRDQSARHLAHRSVAAMTTFDTVDLGDWREVRATVVLRVRDTGYESDDFLEVYITNGSERVYLIDAGGDTGLDDLADDEYVAFWSTVPSSWSRATLVFSTAGDSSASSERYDLRSVEFVSRLAIDPCDGETPPRPPAFRRGDPNLDDVVNLTDGIKVLEYLFRGTLLSCLDAADSDDSGGLNLGDAVRIFGFLFRGDDEPPPPGPFECGRDPTDDALGCDVECDV